MNRLVLSASIVERGGMRYTPAGLPALDLRLAHESTVTEAGHPRQVRMELRSVVIGPMAERLNRIELGVPQQFAGFLAAQRNGRGVVFHITELL
ncbi:primosomal replication protein N [Caldimonas thermodepolymerans]|jgi:primosomal replication protein N|nr:primosomal replication protein N [Caldimonas thermodepolymerans]QPC30096.1 primosomal replication protein N [Caldimonas thermodepolymerans]UZG42849.1 primosomal replication protein N [Caldimonas thermodepolymerans]UZG46514.1 primosomal replication protein N [Caldimonas thermodepolymerans]